MLNHFDTIDEVRNYMRRLYTYETLRKLSRDRGVKGQIERARLRGKRVFYIVTRFGGHEIVVLQDEINSTAMPFVRFQDETNGGGMAFPVTNLENNNFRIMIIRGHAVERYVQRYIFHDEKHKVTPEEFVAAQLYIFENTHNVVPIWDDATDAYLINLESGAFIVRQDDRCVLYQTYLPVSKMFANQRLANGEAAKENKHLNETIGIDMLKLMAHDRIRVQYEQYMRWKK